LKSICLYIIIVLLLVLSSCVDDKVVGSSSEVIERPAGSETYFVYEDPKDSLDPNVDDNTIRIGGVIAVDLEAKDEVLADSIVDSFDSEPGVDIVKLSVVNGAVYHFRIAEGIDIELELIDPFNATVFRLSASNPSYSGELQPGNYGLKFYNNRVYEDSVDNRLLLFLKPDTELIDTDPLGILNTIPPGNLTTDHYLIVQSGGCDGCDLSQGDFSNFIFHPNNGERISLRDITLKSTNLSHSILSDADITGTFATSVDFSYASLRNSTFTGFGEISHSSFERSDLNSSTFTNISGRFTNFNYSDLRRIVMTDFSLPTSAFVDCIALEAEFTRGVLTNTEFTYFKGGGATLTDIDFSGSDFDSADLVGCDLANSQLNACDLSEANFSNAYVAGASFCRIIQYRNLQIKLAIGIAEAECLLDLIEKIDESVNEQDSQE